MDGNSYTSDRHKPDQHQPETDSDQVAAALHEYVATHADRVSSSMALLKSEIRLGLLTLIAAAAAAVAAVVMLLTAWVMAMVGLAEYTADFFATSGINILVLAGFNAAFAVGLYLFTCSMLSRVLKIRPFRMLLG